MTVQGVHSRGDDPAAEAAKRLPKVSVVVPGHNASSTLDACLSRLRAQEWPQEALELVYVDDASTDGSPQIASRWADRVVRLGDLPRGPAAARNAGVEASSGDVIVFIDADVVAPAGTVEALLRPMLEDQELDAVFGSYDSEPSHPSLISQYRNLLHHYVHQISRHQASTFWAGCGAVRRSSFEKAGGFDEKLYRTPMIEDIELGRRMCAAGMRIQLRGHIQVKHLKRWTATGMVVSDIFSRGIPWMRLLLRGGQRSREIGDLNLDLRSTLSVPLTWAVVLLLVLAVWAPILLWASLAAAAAAILLNLPIYAFFYRVRGLAFALAIIPLHLLFHFCNGISVIGAVLYRVLFDRPLFGLKSMGAALRTWYWNRHSRRRAALLAARKKEHR